jgi:predicted amidophosphoribosyltransferase
MNREKHLMNEFPDKRGRTYIQALNEFLSKERGICPKCNHLLDKEGICWRCLTESNK